jgi:hypothetical protein
VVLKKRKKKKKKEKEKEKEKEKRESKKRKQKEKAAGDPSENALHLNFFLKSNPFTLTPRSSLIHNTFTN